jgi:hypothetical protein
VSAPDAIEPIVGRRCWGLAEVRGELLLCSGHGRTVWPGGERFAAACSRAHTPPGASCSCGVYALSTSEPWPYFDYDGPGYAVWGEVLLWGTVVRGTAGYRAQFAYPWALHLAHKDYGYLERLRTSYPGVPVTLRNPFPEVERGDR